MFLEVDFSNVHVTINKQSVESQTHKYDHAGSFLFGHLPSTVSIENIYEDLDGAANSFSPSLTTHATLKVGRKE